LIVQRLRLNTETIQDQKTIVITVTFVGMNGIRKIKNHKNHYNYCRCFSFFVIPVKHVQNPFVFIAYFDLQAFSLGTVGKIKKQMIPDSFSSM